MKETITDKIIALTDWIRTHPFVSFVAVIAPVFGVALTISNIFYHGAIEGYRSQIDNLKLTSLVVTQNKARSSPEWLNGSSDRAIASQHSSYPAIKNVRLYKGNAQLLWNGDVKVVFTKMLNKPSGFNIMLFIGEIKKELTLYADNRQIFSFEDHDYFIDLLSVFDQTIEIAITPKKTG